MALATAVARRACYTNSLRKLRVTEQRQVSRCCRGFQQSLRSLAFLCSSQQPHHLNLTDDLQSIRSEIKQVLRENTSRDSLNSIAQYYFDSQGKGLRPELCLLMAGAVNFHQDNRDPSVRKSQRTIALFSEMVHTASLLHDDIIDQANLRRGKPSINVKWNHRQVCMAGDYIVSVALLLVSRLGDDDVTVTLSNVMKDLVLGELQQMRTEETENEQFAHYLQKTHRKTASLMAHSMKAISILAGGDEHLRSLAFEYGRNVGMAFQLMDDYLDFASTIDSLGKPSAVDLKLGLATAPVLFACHQHPELRKMILRRFSFPGDVDRAFELVYSTDGLQQTQLLAKKHCQEAQRTIRRLRQSSYSLGLLRAAECVINRER